MAERISWIDFAKGVAIILVVWGHTLIDGVVANKFVAAFRMPFAKNFGKLPVLKYFCA